MQKVEEKPQVIAEPKRMSKHASQSNFYALGSSMKVDDKTKSRGNIFNSIGKDVIGAAPLEVPNYQPREETKIYSGLQTSRNDKLSFDEYLTHFEKAKQTEGKRSPIESRSKYFNDVFASKVNLGSKNDGHSSP